MRESYNIVRKIDNVKVGKVVRNLVDLRWCIKDLSGTTLIGPMKNEYDIEKQFESDYPDLKIINY